MVAYVLKSAKGYATGPVVPNGYRESLSEATLYGSRDKAQRDKEPWDEIIEVVVAEAGFEHCDGVEIEQPRRRGRKPGSRNKQPDTVGVPGADDQQVEFAGTSQDSTSTGTKDEPEHETVDAADEGRHYGRSLKKQMGR